MYRRNCLGRGIEEVEKPPELASQPLNDLLYSHPHGWAPVAKIEEFLAHVGCTIEKRERDNRTDGEYHKRFRLKNNVLVLHANQWDAKTFQPLVEWFSGI